MARSLSNNSRYIDDVSIINYKNFLVKAKDIYPAELILDRNGMDDHNAVYLDIQVKIRNNTVQTSLYNKTDDFNFPVVSFTFPDSCVPSELGYQENFSGERLQATFAFSLLSQMLV